MPFPTIDPDKLSRIVVLTYGQMNHGGPYWCYVAVKPSRYEAFKNAMDSKQYHMPKFEADGFGEVIVSGEGVVPPGDVTKEVAKMFNIPVRQLFAQTDPMMEINHKIKQLNNVSAVPKQS